MEFSTNIYIWLNLADLLKGPYKWTFFKTSLLHVFFYQFWHADYEYDIFKMEENGYYDFWIVRKGPSAPTMRPAHQQTQYGGFYFQHTNAFSAHQHIFSAPTAQWIAPISISNSSVFSAPTFCQQHQYFFIDTSASNYRAPTHFHQLISSLLFLLPSSAL